MSQNYLKVVPKLSPSCSEVVSIVPIGAQVLFMQFSNDAKCSPSCPKCCLQVVPNDAKCSPSCPKWCPSDVNIVPQRCQVVFMWPLEMCWVSASHLTALASMPLYLYYVVIEDRSDLKNRVGWCHHRSGHKLPVKWKTACKYEWSIFSTVGALVVVTV